MKRDDLIKALLELPEDANVLVQSAGCGCCSEGNEAPELWETSEGEYLMN